MDVDTPVGGMFFDDREDFGGDLFALGKELVERGFGGDATHSGLGELEHGVIDVFDFVNGLCCIRHFVVYDGVHFAGDVVPRDSVLLGDVDGFGADVDFAEGLKEGDDQFPAGADDIGEATHRVDDPTLVFIDLLEGGEEEDDEERDQISKEHSTSSNELLDYSIAESSLPYLT